MHAGDIERYEAVEEFTQLFGVVQAMGRRPTEEAHGPSYDEVRELNELLHQARMKIDAIRTELFGSPRVLMEQRAHGWGRPHGFLRKQIDQANPSKVSPALAMPV